MNVARMIGWGAQRHAERVAFVFDGREWTFAEVDDRSTRLANSLRAAGVEKGDRVGILIENRPEYAEAEFAVAKAGAVRVPMLTTLTVSEVADYLSFASVVAIVVSEDRLPVARDAASRVEHGVRIVVVGEAGPGEASFEQLIGDGDPTPPDVDILDDDPHAIRFTGGTTGRPKAVLMSHRSMVNVINNQLLNWPIFGTDDVGLSIHPLSHAAGMMMYPWWVRGMTHVIRPAFRIDPDEVLEVVERHRVTSVFLIPTVLNVLLDSGAPSRHDASSLRAVVYGGAPMPTQRLREALDTFGPVFIQVYGTSEAPFVLATLLADEHVFEGSPPARLSSAGRVALNVEVEVASPDGGRCARGEVGEIVARGANVMDRYWDNEELTEQRLRDGWLHTGDMGRFDADGYLHVVDRKEDMVITGGFNVWPAEVEDVIYQHPAVHEVAVFGVEHRKWGEAVAAVVVPREAATLERAELEAFLRERLTAYKVPKGIVFRDEALPRSAVGKVVRRQVRDAHSDEIERLVA